MSTEILGITWAYISYWPCAVLIMSACILLLIMRYRSIKRMVQHLVGNNSRLLLVGFSLRKLHIKLILLFIGMMTISLALLRPEWKARERTVAQEGRDVLIALDISRSMLATDIKPNRLEFAKKKIKKLVNALSCERVGLIVFSGSAFILCPLTSDVTAFSLFLDQVDVQTIASGTTALDAALSKAIDIYEQMPTKKNKLLVVLTDGEDFSSNLAALKIRAQEQQVRIFTVGVGTQSGAPIPVIDQQGNAAGHVKDERDKIVISQLNEGILRSLAHDVGGIYLHASNNEDDVHTIGEWVSRFEKEQFEDAKISIYEDQYPWFLVISFVCFLFEWLI